MNEQAAAPRWHRAVNAVRRRRPHSAHARRAAATHMSVNNSRTGDPLLLGAARGRCARLRVCTYAAVGVAVAHVRAAGPLRACSAMSSPRLTFEALERGGRDEDPVVGGVALHALYLGHAPARARVAAAAEREPEALLLGARRSISAMRGHPVVAASANGCIPVESERARGNPRPPVRTAARRPWRRQAAHPARARLT